MISRATIKSAVSARPDDQTIFYDRAVLGCLGAADAPGDILTRDTLDWIRGAADAALARGPYSVVDKTVLPPSRDRHDYFHPSPYFWPRSFWGLRLPGKRRDGRRVPGTRLYEPASDQYDRTRLQRMFDDSTVLALAWTIFGQDAYAVHAVRLIESWFVTEETRMNPNLNYAQFRVGKDRGHGRASGIIEFKDVYFFLDAVRILKSHEAWSPSHETAFRAWMESYLEWLLTSEQGRAESKSINNHGTYYDLQVGSIARYLQKYELLEAILSGVEERLRVQFEPNGFQALEAKRTLAQHYFAFNLQGWMHLSMLGASCGCDLWKLSEQVGRPLERALEYFLAYTESTWDLPQVEPFDCERFWPLILEYCLRDGGNPGKHEKFKRLTALNPLLFPHYGIRPFWHIKRQFWDCLQTCDIVYTVRSYHT